MNSENLKTFLTVMEMQSYTKAAQNLMVAPSTIGKRIKELESEVGKPLFISGKKQLRLTTAGSMLAQAAIQIVALNDDCINSIANMSQMQNQITIGTTTSLLENYVSDCIHNYLSHYPDSQIDVVVGDSRQMLHQLYDTTIDIIFSYQKFSEKNYTCVPFTSDAFVLVTGYQNDQYKDGITLNELRKQALIWDSLSYITDREWFDNVLYRDGKKATVRVHNGTDMLHILQRGFGYGFAPRKCVKKYFRHKVLREIPLLDATLPPLQNYMLFKQQSFSEKDEFIRMALDYAKKEK